MLRGVPERADEQPGRPPGGGVGMALMVVALMLLPLSLAAWGITGLYQIAEGGGAVALSLLVLGAYLTVRGG